MLQQVLGINVRLLNLFSAKQEKLRTKMSFIRKICHLHSFFITVTAFSQTETKMNTRFKAHSDDEQSASDSSALCGGQLQCGLKLQKLTYGFHYCIHFYE